MTDSLPEALADECGGTPEEFRCDISDVDLESFSANPESFDMSEDTVPVEFEDIDLSEAEEL